MQRMWKSNDAGAFVARVEQKLHPVPVVRLLAEEPLPPDPAWIFCPPLDH